MYHKQKPVVTENYSLKKITTLFRRKTIERKRYREEENERKSEELLYWIAVLRLVILKIKL